MADNPKSHSLNGFPVLIFESDSNETINIDIRTRELSIYKHGDLISIVPSKPHSRSKKESNPSIAKFTYRSPADLHGEKYIELYINPISSQFNLTRQKYTCRAVPQSLAEIIQEPVLLSDNDVIAIYKNDQLFGKLRLNLSNITVGSSFLVESSEADPTTQHSTQCYFTPMPHSLGNTSKPVSIIMETPVADRIMDPLVTDVVDDDSDAETEPELLLQVNTNAQKRDLEQAEADNLEGVSNEPPAKRSKVSSPVAEIPTLEVRSIRASPSPMPSSKNSRESPQSHIITVDKTDDGELHLPQSIPESPNTKSSQTHNSRTRQNKKLHVAFSGVDFDKMPGTLAMFKKSIAIDSDVTDQTDFLCIQEGHIKPTAKLMKAKALGKLIIGDRWITQCAKAKSIIEHHTFIARAKQVEKELKIPENWSIEGRPNLIFKDKSVYFTPTLKKAYGKAYKEMGDILSLLGAKALISYTPKDVAKQSKNLDLIAIGIDDQDKDTKVIISDSIPIYNKQIVSTSIIRGSLDLDSNEFRLFGNASASTAKKGKSS